MKHRVRAILLLFVAAALLAGCLSADEDEKVTPNASPFDDEPRVGLVIEHEQGTAYEKSSPFLVQNAKRCAAVGPTLADACRETYPVLDEAPHVDGVPAPFMDVTQVSFAETPTELIITMELADLDEAWSGLEGPDADTDLWYWVCWDLPEVDADGEPVAQGCASLLVARIQGEVAFWSSYVDISEACNDWWLCWSDVPIDISYGEPGALEWTIPRGLMLYGGEGDLVGNPSFETYRHYGAGQGWRAQLAWSLREGPLDERGWNAIPGQVEVIDTAASDEPFIFQTSQAPPDKAAMTVDRVESPMKGTTSDWTGVYRADLDVHEVGIEETDTTFTVSIDLAAVEAEPEAHILEVYVAMPSGRVHMAGYDVVEGQRQVWAGYEVPEDDGRWVNDPVSLEVEPGSPGRVHFTWARSDLGSPMAGERLTLLWMTTGPERPVVEESVGPLTAQVLVNPGKGGAWPTWGPPFWFELDSASPPAATTQGLVVEDDVADAELPANALLDRETADRYDITFLQAAGHEPSTVALTIGIRDLSRVAVPTGYDAVIYAVGLETEAGRFMAFFYKDDTQQDFYCATDTLVLTEGPTDPTDAVWTRIQGLQAQGRSAPNDDAAAGRGETGALTLYVPYACLGVTEPGPFMVHAMDAGTYLLEDPLDRPETAEVHAVDQVRPTGIELPFPLGSDEVATTTAVAWYEDPFGVRNFWDIAGVALAVALAGTGALFVRRRRSLLKEYLQDVQHAVTADAKRPRALEKTLLGIRSRLRDDLLRGRMRDEHYVLVEQRLEAELSKARVHGLVDLFGDLPHRIVVNLEEMLGDGELSQRDYDILGRLLDDSPLEKDAKRAIKGRLATWLTQDAPGRASASP